MAEPDWNPDTGGRPLAEILREAGIDTSRAAKRRRWDEPDEPVRQRRPDAQPPADRPFGRRRSDAEEQETGAVRSGATRAGSRQLSASRAAPGTGSPPVRPSGDRRAVAGPSTTAIPEVRPARSPGVPHPSAPLPDIPLGALRGDRVAERVSGRDTGRVTDRAVGRDTGRVADRAVGRDTGRVADRAVGRDTGRVADRAVGRDTGRLTDRAVRPGHRAAHRDELTSTGPIPVVRAAEVDDLDEDASPLAWLRFVGELVIALAVGVGVFFAATVLWEMAAYVALLLVPLAVTGLVAGVGMWRQRQGADPVGPRLLALLVFAGTLLTIVPAAQLLATR
ncbi:hypothetical protein [Blastococcus goldschmidtiae]|uniref:Uncharacterized protein n=1 Tax=Blastococcus goldschmidtiae TaxID=3075546 RepID=A0ABU2K3S5_9ACTN|nr:hypothetical protein [Blastococcus sp. DSM 46792]MDT0274841.1 hypothetical protein [Blastococcus sp. DSM 46792]